MSDEEGEKKTVSYNWEGGLAKNLRRVVQIPQVRIDPPCPPHVEKGIVRAFRGEIELVEDLKKARVIEFEESAVVTGQMLILREIQKTIDRNNRRRQTILDTEEMRLTLENVNDTNPELLFDVHESDILEEIQNFSARKKLYEARLERLATTEKELGEGKWIGYEAQQSNVEECLACPGKIKSKSLDLLKNKWFDRIILFVIILNCITLALDDPLSKGTPLSNFIVIADYVFMALFVIEMIIKILALGFVKEEAAYLSDPWNVVDFVIICTGLLTIILPLIGEESGNANSLRAFRVLRPLRTITQFPGLRVLVNAVLESLTLLGNTMIVMAFFFLVFGIAGLSLFKGALKYRCFNATATVPTMDPRDVEPLRLCGENARNCNAGYECLKLGENPNSGMVNFDDIITTTLNMFIFVTLEGWSDTMFLLSDASGELVIFYYVLMIMIGAFILINLTLAVILSSFRQSKDRQHSQRLAKEKYEARRRTLMSERRALLNIGTEGEHVPVKSSKWGKVKSAVIMKGAFVQAMKEKRAKRKLSSRVIACFNRLYGRMLVRHAKMKEYVIATKVYAFFQGFIMFCILANSALMACYYHGMSDAYALQLGVFNDVFTYIFIGEMGIMLFIHNPKAYVQDSSMLFDGFLVMFSIVDLILSSLGSDGGSLLQFLSVFRITRVLRIFRIAKNLESMAVIIDVLTKSISSFGYIAMLLLLFMFIFTVLGMQLFAGKLKDDPRNHCDNFWICLVTVFQILTGENWNQLIESFLQTSNVSLLTVGYFVMWIFFGQYVLLNLILAVIMEQFGDIEQKQAKTEAENLSDGYLKRTLTRLKTTSGVLTKMLSEGEEHAAHWSKKHLFCFPPKGKMVDRCNKIIKHPWYETGILTLIGISSFVLVFERPEGSPPEDMDQFLVYLDYFFTVSFFIEMIFKVIGLGFFIGKNSYLRNGWNVLDFFIVIAGSFLMIAKLSNIDVNKIGFLRVLRLLRILRPLRVISRNRGMQLVVRCLMTSMSSIGNVLIVAAIIFFAFAVAGGFLFRGCFWHCSDLDFPENTWRYGVKNTTGGWAVSPCSSEHVDALGEPREWVNARFHFDNFFDAMLTLFVLFSLEGWPDIMWHGLDVTQVDYSPRRENSVMYFVFFMFFIMVASFLLLNLFTGVIFESYLMEKRKMDTRGITLFITEGQQEWIDKCKIYLNVKPPTRKRPPPKERNRKRVYDIVTSSKFESFIFVLIGLNLLQQAVTWDSEPAVWTQTSEIINYLFNVAFIIEAILKIYGLMWSAYWADNWNKFDFILVVFSCVDMTFSALTNFNFLRVLRIGRVMGRLLRILRVSRVARLAKAFSGLRVIGTTLVTSLPSLFNISILLLLIFFIYAVAGVKFFGNVTQGEFLNSQRNFGRFGDAIRLLFILATGESWNEVMKDAMVYSGSPEAAVFYFCTFVILAQFVMMNLFIMIIVENFDNLNKKKDNVGVDIETAFKTAWESCDIENNGKIPSSKLQYLLKKLPHPYGLSRSSSNAQYMKVLRQLDLSVWPGDKVDFSELLMALHRNARDRQLGEKELKTLGMRPQDISLHLTTRSATKRMSMVDKIRLKKVETGNEMNSLSEHYASLRIGQMFRKWRKHLDYSGAKSPHEQVSEMVKSPVEKVKKLKHDLDLDGIELTQLFAEIKEIEQRVSKKETVVEVKRRTSLQPGRTSPPPS